VNFKFPGFGFGWWLIVIGPVFMLLSWVIVLDERRREVLLTQHSFLPLPRIFPPALVRDVASTSLLSPGTYKIAEVQMGVLGRHKWDVELSNYSPRFLIVWGP
jgi:hypothetical protein